MKFRLLPVLLFIALTSVMVKAFDALIDRTSELGSPRTELVARFEALAAEGAEGDQGKKDAPIPKLGGQSEGAVWSPNAGDGPSSLKPSDVSDVEKDILKNLSTRREELEKWAASIAMKENILNAAEKKINRKMEDLSKLEANVTALLEEYKTKEDLKTQRLVKIYESMKPKDAAAIFEEMDISILLEILGNMKEASAAPILANMVPIKAKDITTRLAKQRQLSMPQ